MKKSQADLRRAEAEIEKLNTQLDKAYLNMNRGAPIVDRSRGKNIKGTDGYLGTSSRLSITKSKSPTSLSKNSEKYPVEGVNFSFGGKESQEGPVHGLNNSELQS